MKCRGHTAITNFPISDYKQELEHHDSVTKEELVQQLRRQGKGSNQNSSKYRGVTKHQKGKWEARIGQVLPQPLASAAVLISLLPPTRFRILIACAMSFSGVSMIARFVGMQVVGRKYKYLGLFLTEKEAAEAYDRAAVTAKGIAAQTNFEITNYMELLSASLSPTRAKFLINSHAPSRLPCCLDWGGW
ncbi:MAG: hypothetical protein HC767_13470 [Akkermansiaceae bacterium]|nr:hypothetical protein [Akkermansiaceae bacterium]